MTEFQNQSRLNPPRSDYVWQYEYYDDEEPVSFEGLKAHRYSIVIGFWVGLAVFVIFMFFVLTLLTKTGALHQDNTEPSEKRQHPGSCLVEMPLEDLEKAFSRPLLGQPRSFFHFYISEEEQPQPQSGPGEQRAGGRAADSSQNGAWRWGQQESHGLGCIGSSVTGKMADKGEGDEALQPIGGPMQETTLDTEIALMSHFDIPNFVKSETGSTLAEDDLLLCETAIPPATQPDSHLG